MTLDVKKPEVFIALGFIPINISPKRKNLWYEDISCNIVYNSKMKIMNILNM